MPKLVCLFSAAVTLVTWLLPVSNTSLHAQGLTLYVAPNGSDAWSGKVAEPKDNDGPFASIGRARDAIRQWKAAQGGLKEPVTVRIRGGEYFLSETISFTPEDSGTQQCPISYEAFPGEQPVLCGGQTITGWQPYQGEILVATLPEVQAGKWYFRSLFADGRRQIRARHPNVDPADPYRKGLPVRRSRHPGLWLGGRQHPQSGRLDGIQGPDPQRRRVRVLDVLRRVERALRQGRHE